MDAHQRQVEFLQGGPPQIHVAVAVAERPAFLAREEERVRLLVYTLKVIFQLSQESGGERDASWPRASSSSR